MSAGTEMLDELLEHDLVDAPHPNGDDRYAIYAVRLGMRRRIAETSRDGIGLALVSLRSLDPDGLPDPGGSEDFTDRDAIGIFDRQTRKWIVNPWANAR